MGFRNKKKKVQLELIHAEITKNESTCKVVSTRCQAVPKMLPWQWARLRIALMHCRFLAVSITGPC